jgi:peptide-methionine (S)-S-oxide reductase
MAIEKATFGAGCFWCAEAALKLLPGVIFVKPGYAGIVEVAQVEYDPAKVSYGKLLEVFWTIHNPTEKNKQGPDVGPQYQAVIFYHTKEQQSIAQQTRKEQSLKYKELIATEILPFTDFREAEEYHRNFYERNPNNPYSRAIIAPKVEKVKKLLNKNGE